MRFLYRDDPPADKLPTSESFLVSFDELPSVLPKDTPKVTPEQRREEIPIRQSHIKMRWRNH